MTLEAYTRMMAVYENGYANCPDCCDEMYLEEGENWSCTCGFVQSEDERRVQWDEDAEEFAS